MAKTVEEQLEETLTSINTVEQNGQRYTIKDRELWRADLRQLDQRAQRLEKQAERAKRGGLRIQRVIPL
ncbi:hypothetical protein GGD67_003837 [Bradyrhizobium sp. IAR9]|uniref:hypothetical protein n=1 Tax=Bradyrhizobium sp. IAR9 TaxID=2663841 RepID=UPI0015CB780A|nr:hypothetical protein [Bradyrhizobium sp. IAR9]NYG46366.1 hypothetical protein [Bradyrhizobium sp. IAR9]